MPGSSWQNLGLVLRRVVRTPLAVGLFTVGALFALLTRDGIGIGVLAAAIVLVAIYAAAKLRDETFIRAAIGEARERSRSSSLMDRTFRIEKLDVESRLKMKAIVKLQSEIAADIAGSPVDAVAAGLGDTVEASEELVDRGMAMAQQHRELRRYLTRTDKAAIESRIQSLQAKLGSEQDPVSQAEVKASLASKQHELEEYEAIELACARVLAQLDAIESAFSELRARLVRIKSTNIADWVAANTQLHTQLSGLSTSAANLERSIGEMLTLGNSGQ